MRGAAQGSRVTPYDAAYLTALALLKAGFDPDITADCAITYLDQQGTDSSYLGREQAELLEVCKRAIQEAAK